MDNIKKKLSNVQIELKAPKNRKNTFGNYNYRSAEDILESVKPILAKHGLVQTISDDIILVGDRVYVKATVTVHDNDSDESLSTTAMARETEAKKGMDESQITGSASSYARKYALNGMYAIDDTHDADTMDNTDHVPIKNKPKTTPKPKQSAKPTATLEDCLKEGAKHDMQKAEIWNIWKHIFEEKADHTNGEQAYEVLQQLKDYGGTPLV